MSCWNKEQLENMLEDVVNELHLSDEMITTHGPLGTAPAELVRLVLERKDRIIAMLKAGMVDRTKVDRTKVVCLCGSTKFKKAYEQAMKEETLKGKIVLTVGLFGHLEGLDMNGEVKKMLDELHKKKIDLADEVLILNVCGYIGESTRGELDYAIAHGKLVRMLEEPSHDPK